MKRQEWTNRCAKRLQKNAGLSWQQALREASTLADRESDTHGASGIAWQSPEDAADSENVER